MTATAAPSVQPATQDAYAMAMDPAAATSSDRTYFGPVDIVDVWACVLEKGIGKRPFDSTRDSIDQRRIAIKLSLSPLRGEFDVKQETINTEKVWKNYTLPSLQKLGLDLRTLKGKYVQVKRVPTGDFFVGKDGERKDRTALVFVDVYPDRDACQRAADEFWEKRKSADASNTNTQSTAASAQAQPPTDMAEREFAKSSLSMLWQVSGQNKDQFLAMIKSNEMIAKYFDETSDEVQAILSPELMA
jgi:hypothetical protein